jgi:hypothetical protein
MSTVLKSPSPAARRISELASGYVASSALNTVARLGIADHLSARPLSAVELAEKTKTHADSLCRVLRMLSSLGIFEEVAEQTFANNEASETLKADVPQSQRDLIIFITDPFHLQAYSDMLPTVRDGRPATQHMWKKDCFEVFENDKELQKRFDDAMTAISRNSVPAILQSYDFSGIGTLVDVAGGHGFLLTAILQKYPTMKGVLFDLPHVVGGAKSRVEELGLADRCKLESGDFFKSVPAADAIVMKHIIHDWNDEKSIAILRSCAKALSGKTSGKVILIELLVAERNEPHLSKFMDIEMLMLTGGRERSKEEYSHLFAQAGLKLSKVVPVQNSPHCLIEAVLT